MWGRSRFARSLINPDSGVVSGATAGILACSIDAKGGVYAALTDYIDSVRLKLCWLWLLSAGMNLLMKGMQQRFQVVRNV